MAVDLAKDHEVTLQQVLSAEPDQLQERHTFNSAQAERIHTATGCKVSIRARAKNAPRTMTIIGRAGNVELARRMALSAVTGLM